MTAPVVLITGALAGIGRATALAFARQGARLIVSGRRDDVGQALAGDLRELGAEALATGHYVRRVAGAHGAEQAHRLPREYIGQGRRTLDIEHGCRQHTKTDQETIFHGYEFYPGKLTHPQNRRNNFNADRIIPLRCGRFA